MHTNVDAAAPTTVTRVPTDRVASGGGMVTGATRFSSFAVTGADVLSG